MGADPVITDAIAVLAARRRDAELTCEFLRDRGIAAFSCRDLGHLIGIVGGPIGAVMVTEQILVGPGWQELADALDHQPPWSDLPIVVFAGRLHETADR